MILIFRDALNKLQEVMATMNLERRTEIYGIDDEWDADFKYNFPNCSK